MSGGRLRVASIIGSARGPVRPDGGRLAGGLCLLAWQQVDVLDLAEA